jgi:hypothetical protein
MPDPGSLQAYINAGIAERQADAIQKVPVPRYQGRLVVRYKAIDARSLIRIGIDAEKNPDEVSGVIDAAVAVLLASCDGCETTMDGETTDLGVKLGTDLTTLLGITEILTPEEAVYAVFEDEVAIVNTANQLRQFQQLAGAEITEAVVGNSEAAS